MRPSHLATRYKYDLSPRQREVLALIARGCTNAEIADQLGISLDGAKYHVREILAKLDVSSREEAAAEWRRSKNPVARLRVVSATVLAAVGARIAIAAAAAVVLAGAGFAAVVLLVATGDEAPSTPSVTSAPTVQPTAAVSPTATASAVAALPSCTSATAALRLDLLPAGDNVRLQLSASGSIACTLSGPVWLHIIRVPADPAPLGPPRAALEDRLTVNLDFPFVGVLGEWTWSNWCVPVPPASSPHIWEARAGADGEYLASGVSVDLVPACVVPGSPSTLNLQRLVAGLDGEIDPPAACLGREPLWLCRVAAQIALQATPSGVRELVRVGEPATYICGADGRTVGFDYTDLCAGATPGETRAGYPLALHGSEGGPRSAEALLSEIEPSFAPPGVSLAAVGCPVADPGCASFVVAFRSGKAPAVVYLVFRLSPGREPALVGAGLSGDNADDILSGGRTFTGLGLTDFVPIPPPG